MNQARWLVSMAASDEQRFKAWAERCERLGVATTVAAALRLAVELGDSLTDDDIKRGFA